MRICDRLKGGEIGNRKRGNGGTRMGSLTETDPRETQSGDMAY